MDVDLRNSRRLEGMVGAGFGSRYWGGETCVESQSRSVWVTGSDAAQARYSDTLCRRPGERRGLNGCYPEGSPEDTPDETRYHPGLWDMGTIALISPFPARRG